MLSIIVPFYKDYPYLRQAVQSVLSQGLQKFEIIVVNDNPTPEAMRFLEAQDFPDSVKIVHHEVNRGLSAARNTGIENASGNFIAYLDADDYYLAGGLAQQFKRARETRADVTHSTTLLRMDSGVGSQNLTMVGRDKQMFRRNVDSTTVDLDPTLQFIISSWKSIYRRDFLERTQIAFDEVQRKFEDRLYVLETVFSGGSFALSSAPTRVWRRRPDSITTSAKSDTDLVMMAGLIDKCTALIERKVNEDGYDPIYLKREVFHSTARLIWDTPLLPKAAQSDEIAMGIRETLHRSLGRAQLDSTIFDDPIVSRIDRAGLANPAGEKVTEDGILNTWKAIADGDWSFLDTPKTDEQTQMAPSVSPATKAKTQPVMAVPTDGEFADVELILHIGQHKTGTTHLQREYFKHRDEMIAEGVLFPRTGYITDMETSSKAEATPGHQGILRAIVDNNKTVLQELKDEVAASGCKKVLISCENLSFPYQPPQERQRRVGLANTFFAAFPNRKVVSVVRRPDEYLESLYRERVGNAITRETRNASEYLSSFRGHLLNLSEALEPWQAFANDNLQLLGYGEMKRAANYAHAFAKALGLGVEGLFPNEPHLNRRTYTSAGWDEIELMRLLNMVLADEKRRRATAQSFLNTCAASGRSGKLSLLSPDERIGIIREVRDTSGSFLEAHGLTLDFDAMIAELETELETWSLPETMKIEKVEALMNAITASQHIVKPGFPRPGNRAKMGAGNGQKNALKRFIASHEFRSALHGVYVRMPTKVQRAARWAYGRIS